MAAFLSFRTRRNCKHFQLDCENSFCDVIGQRLTNSPTSPSSVKKPLKGLRKGTSKKSRPVHKSKSKYLKSISEDEELEINGQEPSTSLTPREIITQQLPEKIQSSQSTPLRVFDDMGEDQRIAYESLKSTEILTISDIHLCCSKVQNFAAGAMDLSELIGRNSRRLRRSLEKLQQDEYRGVSGILIWTELVVKLTLLVDWSEEDKISLSSQWLQFFLSQRKLVSTLNRYAIEMKKFQEAFESYIQSLLQKNRELKSHFRKLIGPSWDVIMKHHNYIPVEEIENTISAPRNEIRITSRTNDVFFVNTELPETCYSDPAQVLKFSDLVSSSQMNLLSQTLATICFIFWEVDTNISTSKRKLYDKKLLFNMPTLTIEELVQLGSLDSLVLVHTLRGTLHVHARDCAHLIALQNEIANLQLLIPPAKTVLQASGIQFSGHELGESIKQHFPPTTDHSFTSLIRHFVDFELDSYVINENLLMRTICEDFIAKYGKTLAQKLKIQWKEEELGKQTSESVREESKCDSFKAITLFSTLSETPEVEAADSWNELFCRFSVQVLNSTLSTLKRVYAPKASIEPILRCGQTKSLRENSLIQSQPVGYVEGLCHLISVASSQLKVTEKTTDAEILRKRFFSVTNALAHLSVLRQSVTTRLMNKIGSALEVLEYNSDIQLERIFEDEIPQRLNTLPICQIPNPNLIFAIWSDEKKGNHTEATTHKKNLTIQWEAWRPEVLHCSINQSTFEFSKLSFRNQLKLMLSLLSQLHQLVISAAESLQTSKSDYTDAKETLTSIAAYFTQLEKREEIRAEEKDVLLLALRAQIQTVYHQMDHLEKCLRRTRFSLSNAIRNIRGKLGHFETNNQINQSHLETNPKINPFGYSVFHVLIPLRLAMVSAKKLDQSKASEEKELTNGGEKDNELHAITRFFRHISQEIDRIGELLWSGLLTARAMLTDDLDAEVLPPPKMIGLILLLGKTLVGIGNFRDVTQSQHRQISNGFALLLKKFKEFQTGSSLYVKLAQALEKAEKEADLISNQLRLSMNTVTQIHPGCDAPEMTRAELRMIQKTTYDNIVTSNEITENEFWILYFENLLPDTDAKGDGRDYIKLVLTRENSDLTVAYEQLTRMKQGAVVIGVLQAIQLYLQNVIDWLKSMTLSNIRTSWGKLKFVNNELVSLVKQNGLDPELDMSPEIRNLMTKIHLHKTRAHQIFRLLGEEWRDAVGILKCVQAYGKIRIKTEAKDPPRSSKFEKRKWRRGGHGQYKHEQETQIHQIYKKKVQEIETFLEASSNESSKLKILISLDLNPSSKM